MKALITLCILFCFVTGAAAELECGYHQLEDGRYMLVDCSVDPPAITYEAPPTILGEPVKVTAEPEQGSGGGGCFITSSYK